MSARSILEERERHWRELTAEQQHEAIRRMAREGDGDHTIAAATGFSVEMVRRILAETPKS